MLVSDQCSRKSLCCTVLCASLRQNEIHLDEIRKLRKSAQEQAIRVSSLNKLLDERSERIRQLETERYSTSASAASTLPSTGLTGAHAFPAGGADSGEVDRLRSRHQELLARVLELERQLNEKVLAHAMRPETLVLSMC